MKLLKIITFLSLYFVFTNSAATERSKIINKLNSTNNIQFDFSQQTNKKIETGKCILVFPSKLKCNYENKNQKEVIINKKMMAITQKRYGKTLFYPLSKSSFLNILSKNELINIINESNIVIDEYLNIIFVGKDNSKTLIRFDKKDFLLAGWISSDQYNNKVIFNIKITSVNQIIDEKIFTLPNRS